MSTKLSAKMRLAITCDLIDHRLNYLSEHELYALAAVGLRAEYELLRTVDLLEEVEIMRKEQDE
jgi:hypothetical protein